MDKTSLSIKQQNHNIPINHSRDVTLYLHIGQNKTGTSAIQKFLDINRLKLFKEFGCLYPNFFANDYLLGVCNNHTSWYKSVKDNREKFINDLNNLIGFAIKNDISKIVLSSEAWFLRNEVIRNFEYLIERFNFVKIKPICYLRRIDLWIESAWKQWGLKEYDSFEDFYDQPRYYQIYQNALEHLNIWGEIIPIKNIIVRPYEKQQLAGGLLNDFLKIIGIDYESNNWNQIKNDNLSVNRGFNRDVLEILHYCRELYTNVHDNRYFDLFSDLLGDDFQKKPFEPYELLSPQQRWKLYSKNFPFEQEIAEKYMERKDRKIFYDSLPDPDDSWEPYEGLTLEKAIPIIIKLINENNRKLSVIQRKFKK